MKILDVHVYKDGGTKLIETDEGSYWIPYNDGGVYKGEYFKGEFTPVEDKREIIELLNELCSDASTYHWIKRKFVK